MGAARGIRRHQRSAFGAATLHKGKSSCLECNRGRRWGAVATTYNLDYTSGSLTDPDRELPHGERFIRSPCQVWRLSTARPNAFSAWTGQIEQALKKVRMEAPHWTSGCGVGGHVMFGWFTRKPTRDGMIQLKNTPESARNGLTNVALSRAPLDRDLYSQAIKSKGYMSLKAVHDEYEQLVLQKLQRDKSNEGEIDDQRIGNNSKNDRRRDENEVSVKFSPWNIVRGELIRVYGLKSLSGSRMGTKVELRCRLIVEGSQIKPFVHLLVKPSFSEQSKSVASIFAPSDDIDGYKILIARVEAADAGVNFVTYDMGDGDHLVKILKLGREITVQLAESEGDHLRYVIPHLVLPNDATFSDRYDFFKATTPLGIRYD
jgi:hypothetical protein